MKILHYGLSPNYGGIEMYLKELCTSLHDRGVQSEFIYGSNREPAYYDHFKELGCTFHRITPRSQSTSQNKRDIAQVLRRHNFDALHHHAASDSYSIPIRVAIKAEVPALWHSHNSGPAPSFKSQVLHRLNQRSLPWKKITKVAVSEAAGKWAFGDNQSFEIIPNGIDLQRFSTARKKREQTREMLRIGKKTLIITQVGTLSKVKNHMFTLETFREVLSSHPDTRLLIVGDGYLSTSIQNYISKHQLTKSVRLLGRREDVANLLGATDVLMVPSKTEGFSLAALEAQAAGVACIASENVPKEVLVADNAYQLHLRAGPEAWAKHILTRRLTYETHPLAALENAGFTSHRNANRIVNVYRSLTMRKA